MGAVVVAVFFAVLAIVYGAYWLLIVRPEQQESGAVRRRLRGTRVRGAKAEIGKSDEALSTVGALDAALQRWTGLSDPLKQLLERSGLPMTVGLLVLLTVFVAVVTTSVSLFLSPYTMPALVLGLLAGTVPYL